MHYGERKWGKWERDSSKQQGQQILDPGVVEELLKSDCYPK